MTITSAEERLFHTNEGFHLPDPQPARPLADILAPYQSSLETTMTAIQSEITTQKTFNDQTLTQVYATCAVLHAAIVSHQSPPRYKVTEVNPHPVTTFFNQYFDAVKEIRQDLAHTKKFYGRDISDRTRLTQRTTNLSVLKGAFSSIYNQVVSEANSQ